jgi:hypothetical protein
MAKTDIQTTTQVTNTDTSDIDADLAMLSVRDQAVIDLTISGKASGQIAAYLGVHRETICKILRKPHVARIRAWMRRAALEKTQFSGIEIAERATSVLIEMLTDEDLAVRARGVEIAVKAGFMAGQLVDPKNSPTVEINVDARTQTQNVITVSLEKVKGLPEDALDAILDHPPLAEDKP